MQRPVLIVGGAPKIKIDAVRYLSVQATGRTALYLHEQLVAKACASTVLLADDVACPAGLASLMRYQDRTALDRAIDGYLCKEPHAVIVMTAAVNDYELAALAAHFDDGSCQKFAATEKIPSGAEELIIHLRGAPKLIDSLAERGHCGPLVACKYEEAATVIASAQALQTRVDADVVLANSLCGTVQALVDRHETRHYETRDDVLRALVERIEDLAQTH